MEDTRVCGNCGIAYSRPDGWDMARWRKSRLRYCSVSCYRTMSVRPRPARLKTKACERCRTLFGPQAGKGGVAWEKAKYCSLDCYNAVRREASEAKFARTRTCPICKVEFTSIHAPDKQTTCWSEDCKRRYVAEIKGPATSARIKADYVAGRRYKLTGWSPIEKALWEHLRPLGWQWNLKWREECGSFELDFARMVELVNVELDGPEHRHGRRKAADEIRDAELVRRGWRILRIPNTEVDADPLAVVAKITAFAS